LGGEAEGDVLSAAERGEAAVQREVGQAEAAELGAGALLDVPVVSATPSTSSTVRSTVSGRLCGR
jgi:hypothetical protein